MKAWIAVALLISASLALTSGCLEEDNGATVIITDMLGRDVKVPEKVERVVGIEAGALRLLVYMGHTDKVVGIEDNEKSSGAGGSAKPYIFANPELLDLASIGPWHGGDAELIVAAQPDVIFWTFTDVSKADDLQTKTQIPVVALEYGDLNDNKDDLYKSLYLIGKIMGNPERAVEIETFIDDRIMDLDDITRNVTEIPSCYVGGIGYRGAHGLQSTEPAYSPLEFVNGNNVASSVGMEHAFVDKEKILDWNPEIIFIDEGGSDLVMDEIEEGDYDTVRAIVDEEIYGVLPYNWYTTNYGTVLGNSYYIGSVLYPQEFSGIDPKNETDEIYTFLVGDAVYDDMKDAFGGFEELEI